MAIKDSTALKTSRFVHGGTTERANNRLEWWDRRVFNGSDTDIVYTVENFYEGRLDLIAAAFYNEPRYWWLIAMRNNILDPFSEITPGRVLFIPTKERLSTLLTGRAGGIDSLRQNIPLISPLIV